MASRSPLRRWKPFFAAFGLIDAAIEAAGRPSLSRAAFRSARGEVVEMLCGVPAGGDGVAEDLCLVLDGIMAESLVTLRSVPADAVPRVLASSADLAGAVAALGRHESERVRRLAREVIGCWRKSVEGVIAEASAAIGVLDQLLVLPSDDNSNTALVKAPPGAVKASSEPSRPMGTEKAATKTSDSLPKKTPPFACRAGSNDRPDEKMESTKRKLREGYQEFEDAKRERKIQVIEAPKMTEQRQRNMQPILRERSRARCGNTTAVRRCLFPTVQRI